MGKAFISYSHKEVEIVERVNDFLAENHFLTWFDKKSIATGDKWETNIATSVFSCDVFIMFYSRNYRESFYCQKEYELLRQKKNRTALIVIALDDSRDSFDTHDATAIQFLDYDYTRHGVDDLCRLLVKNGDLRHCRILPEESPVEGQTTDFLNALQNLQRPRHYSVLEPLIRFLLWLKERESEGKYISPRANFSSLAAVPLGNKSFKLALTGGDDLCAFFDLSVRNNFVRNVFYALFKFGRVEFCNPAPASLSFESVFRLAPHHFVDATVPAEEGESGLDGEIYSIFNSALSELYVSLPDTDALIDGLNAVFNASKFFETQESRYSGGKQLQYEVNPLIVRIAKRLFVKQNGFDFTPREACLPSIEEEQASGNATVSLSELYSSRHGNILIHGDYGSGKSSLLYKWFSDEPYSLYIDLSNPAVVHSEDIIKNSIDGQSASCYKLDYYGALSYSVCTHRITLLIDNIDNLSEDNRKRVLSEIVGLGNAFRIVLVSSKHNIEGKISLNLDADSLNNFSHFAVKPLSGNQITEYLRFRLQQRGVDAVSILEGLRSLKAEDGFFEIFNSFTKLDILLASVTQWNDCTVREINEEFNSRIRVYQKIFESDGEYSIPKKIASLFKDSVVDIEDVIIKLVRAETEILKRASYRSCNSPSFVIDDEQVIRFRDYYPVLTRIMGRYAFLNEDIRSYFAASYIKTRVEEGADLGEVGSMLGEVGSNYLVLKYLSDFEILSDFDLEQLLQDGSVGEALVYTLYKILQYGNDMSVRAEFLRNARFTVIPDKFFIGAENITRVVVPPCVETVGRAAFANMPKLREIDFAPKVPGCASGKRLTVKPWAILNCPSLQTVRFGANYEKYNHPLFGRCYALRSIVVDGRNPSLASVNDGQMLVSKDGKVLYCSVNSLAGELKVPDGVEILEGNSLSYLKNITSVYLPKTVTDVATNFSDFCDNLMRFTVEEGNPVYYSDDSGLMYTDTEAGKTLFRVPSGIKEDLLIPSDVTVIGSDSISCCIHVRNIRVPAGVRVIENYAFADTYSLETLSFDSIDDVELFGNYIFLSTKETARVIGDIEYSLDLFNATFCRPLGSHRLRGAVRRPIVPDIFIRRGFELLNAGKPVQPVQNAVIARDITLFNTAAYRPQDFNILLIGLTEYNCILTKTPLQAEQYLHDLINKNHISMVVLSRDLPNITIFEKNPEYADLLIMRTGKSSSSATALLSDIIKELGENI